MNFKEYQDTAMSTAIYSHVEGYPETYPILGLCGEAGEVAQKLKKSIRDGKKIDKAEMSSELGDCLWYLAAICCELDISLQDVALDNLRKLADRKARGVLGGSGDRR